MPTTCRLDDEGAKRQDPLGAFDHQPSDRLLVRTEGAGRQPHRGDRRRPVVGAGAEPDTVENGFPYAGELGQRGLQQLGLDRAEPR
ncbi:hypothetical protein [Actinacidiphila soli]|uniref:hypothetical protein n=1 Tax=Actinacidiphila soli TaxID=2487275 RepID=UPI0019D0615A|nr:hypothetical protein [Actinacidiphila soli]